MAEKIRYFKCPFEGCNEISAFDMDKLKNAESNFVVCSKCKSKWHATFLPSCCQISIKFTCLRGLTGKMFGTIQSYNK